MQFLTGVGSAEWCQAVGQEAVAQKIRPSDSKLKLLRGPLTTIPRLVPFCKALIEALFPPDSMLLWVTATQIWPSSEAIHLYYRLRERYGNLELIESAPGHLFLPHEREDIQSFLALGIISGWDMHIVPRLGYCRAFLSHDEFWEVGYDSTANLKVGKQLLKSFQTD
jgi:hypothetical protein